MLVRRGQEFLGDSQEQAATGGNFYPLPGVFAKTKTTKTKVKHD